MSLEPVCADTMAMQDREARRLAQREFGIPLALEAGAGTGKTALLTARLISWCLGPGWVKAQGDSGRCRGKEEGAQEQRTAARVLARVVAITFTEAAASEMGARVAQALSELEAGKLPTGMDPAVLPTGDRVCRQRARALLASLDHLMVQTIHAFCLRLLARFPLEAGIHPRLTVDPDGLLLEELARELVESLLASQQDSRQAQNLLELLQEGVGPQELLETLVQLAQESVPLEALGESPFSASSVSWMKKQLLDSLKRFWEAGGSALRNTKSRSSTTCSLLKALEKTREVLERLPPGSLDGLDSACREIREIWQRDFLDRLLDWSRGRFNKSEQKALAGPALALRQEALELHGWISHVCRMRPVLLTKGLEVLAPLLEQLYKEVRSRGVLSFGGILRETRDLLESNPHVLSQVRLSMDQLLVDEFQDTDLLQCQIIRMIALEGPVEQRPGLFIVGDPKQSIYGWRNADLAAYDAFLEEMARHGGKRLLLSINFRSAPPILREVERAVGPLMERVEGLQPQFQPLLPCPQKQGQRGFSWGPWSAVEYWLCQGAESSPEAPGEKISKSQATELEAKAVANDILRLKREKGVSLSEIGILLRNTGDLEVYLGALREAGVPYLVSSDKNYFRRREVLDATALVRAVLDPTDQLAMVGYLRSAAVGVPDAAWIPLWARGFPGLLAELEDPDPQKLEEIRQRVLEVACSLPSSVPGMERIRGWEANLLAAVECIARLRESFRKEPQDLFVRRMADSTLLEVTEAARYLGSYRLANLQRFFDSLFHSLEKAAGGAQSVLRLLRSCVSRQKEAEEALPEEPGQEAVRVMTIHKAKGLDFSHVYLAQVHKAVGQDPRPRTSAKLLDGKWELSLWGWPSPGYWRLERRAQEVSVAETIRTLYVAMTRARDRLVIAGNFGGRDPQGHSTYASLLRRRKGGIPDFSLVLKACQEEDPLRGLCGDKEVTWKAPGLWPQTMGELTGTTPARKVFSLEQAAQEAMQLQELRHKALARMERPWQGAMSAQAHEALEQAWSSRQGFISQEEAGLKRELAMGLGKIVHRALERLRLGENLEEELELSGQWARQQLLEAFQGQELHQALEKLECVWEGISKGRILGRLKEIGTHVVARELPVLLAPPLEGEGPVGVLAGSIDMLYCDPGDGSWVVADYKTDRVSGPQELLRLCKLYGSQGAYYVRAVQEMMGLDEEPRFELWFLSADEIRVVKEGAL